uniref:Uncharacterized protein n=1 Tax=Noctiluca scintillans TaxID=2966 RepID=A0A7S1AKA9_NOCSC|mmetsp:Transcript_49815/g.132176  ORF Transcript_49815/g.132176 Transcript_49815/m.132176 type:complete len:643 (+) Transcript_49815:106-2034(+)
MSSRGRRSSVTVASSVSSRRASRRSSASSKSERKSETSAVVDADESAFGSKQANAVRAIYSEARRTFQNDLHTQQQHLGGDEQIRPATSARARLRSSLFAIHAGTAKVVRAGKVLDVFRSAFAETRAAQALEAACQDLARGPCGEDTLEKLAAAMRQLFPDDSEETKKFLAMAAETAQSCQVLGGKVNSLLRRCECTKESFADFQRMMQDVCSSQRQFLDDMWSREHAVQELALSEVSTLVDPELVMKAADEVFALRSLFLEMRSARDTKAQTIVRPGTAQAQASVPQASDVEVDSREEDTADRALAGSLSMAFCNLACSASQSSLVADPAHTAQSRAVPPESGEVREGRRVSWMLELDAGNSIASSKRGSWMLRHSNSGVEEVILPGGLRPHLVGQERSFGSSSSDPVSSCARACADVVQKPLPRRDSTDMLSDFGASTPSSEASCERVLPRGLSSGRLLVAEGCSASASVPVVFQPEFTECRSASAAWRGVRAKLAMVCLRASKDVRAVPTQERAQEAWGIRNDFVASSSLQTPQHTGTPSSERPQETPQRHRAPRTMFCSRTSLTKRRSHEMKAGGGVTVESVIAMRHRRYCLFHNIPLDDVSKVETARPLPFQPMPKAKTSPGKTWRRLITVDDTRPR